MACCFGAAGTSELTQTLAAGVLSEILVSELSEALVKVATLDALEGVAVGRAEGGAEGGAVGRGCRGRGGAVGGGVPWEVSGPQP